MKIYGIKNCNSVKKAVDHLNSRGIPFDFHDYKKEGISKDKLAYWSKEVGWESLLNRKGTTWRKLDEAHKEGIKSEKEAIDLMASQTSIIKRPVIEKDGQIILVGYDEEDYAKIL